MRLAMDYNVIPIGTHAHEWFMFHAAYFGYKMANRVGLDNWVNVYRGDLGIALSDTFTTDVFIHSFDKKFAKLFDGVRHDSGDPLVFADKMIAHYRRYNIDPLSKTIIFSDTLTPDLVRTIAQYCRGKIGMSFGIGTNFTNDVGLEPLNMVIKNERRVHRRHLVDADSQTVRLRRQIHRRPARHIPCQIHTRHMMI